MFLKSAPEVVFLAMLALLPILHAQQDPLARNPAAVQAGESEFRINCSFCHGIGARGGGRAPNLTRTQKKHGNTKHDTHDWDATQIPMLVDVGEKHLVVQANRTGFLYVLDRSTGKSNFRHSGRAPSG